MIDQHKLEPLDREIETALARLKKLTDDLGDAEKCCKLDDELNALRAKRAKLVEEED
jgi:hypothetical protein